MLISPKKWETWQNLKKKVSVSVKKNPATIPIPKLNLGFGSRYQNLVSVRFQSGFGHTLERKWIMKYILLKKLRMYTQCPRTKINKRFLPRAKTTTAWKLIPHRSKISKNWNPPHWDPLHRFFKNWFLLVQKQLYNNYIQTHFTK